MKKLLNIIITLSIVLTNLSTFNIVKAESPEIITISAGGDEAKFYKADGTDDRSVYFDEYSRLDANQILNFINDNSVNELMVEEDVNSFYKDGDDSGFVVGGKTYDYYYKYNVSLYVPAEQEFKATITDPQNELVDYQVLSSKGILTYYIFLGLIFDAYKGGMADAIVLNDKGDKLLQYTDKTTLGENVGYYIDNNYMIANVDSLTSIRIYLENQLVKHNKLSDISVTDFPSATINENCYLDVTYDYIVFMYTVIIPYEQWKTNNQGNGIKISYTFEGNVGQELVVNKKEYKSIYDNEGNRYDFNFISEEEFNIGVNFTSNDDNYLGYELSNIETSAGLTTYTIDIRCRSIDGCSGTIMLWSDGDSFSSESKQSEGSLALNGENKRTSFVVYNDNNEQYKKYILNLVVDNSGQDENDYYEFDKNEFIEVYTDYTIDGNSYVYKDGNDTLFEYVVNGDDYSIYTDNEEGFLDALDKLKNFNGGTIVVTKNLTFGEKLIIDHKTDDTNSVVQKYKYDTENCSKYLKIILKNSCFKLEDGMEIVNNSRVAIVGCDKVNQCMLLSGAQQTTGALIVNNGRLQLDKITVDANDSAIKLSDGSLTCLWKSVIEGNTAIVATDADGFGYSLYATNCTITGTVGPAIADERDSSNKDYGVIDLDHCSITGATSAILNMQCAEVNLYSSTIVGSTSAFDIYKGYVNFYVGKDSVVTTATAATNRPIFKVHSTSGTKNIGFKFYDGFFMGTGENSVLFDTGELEYTSIKEIYINRGVFIANGKVFNTVFNDYNIENCPQYISGQVSKYQSLDEGKYKQYASITFSEPITNLPMYTFKKYALDNQDGPTVEDGATGNCLYSVEANKTINVSNLAELENALQYSNVDICLEADIVNGTGENRIIELRNPCNLYLHGHDIVDYTIKINYPTDILDQNASFNIYGKFVDGGGIAYEESTIKNQYGPSFDVEGSTRISGVRVGTNQYDGYAIVVRGYTALSIEENTNVEGKYGVELINGPNAQPLLYLYGNINAEYGYGVFAHNVSYYRGDNPATVYLQSKARLESPNDIAIYSTTKLCFMMDSGSIVGKAGLVVDTNEDLQILLNGGSIHAIGESVDAFNSAIQVIKKNDPYIEILNAEIISDSGYVFELNNPRVTDFVNFTVYNGRFSSGKDYILNDYIGEVKKFKGGYYNTQLSERPLSLIANNYSFKQIDSLSSKYPYAIVRDLSSLSKTVDGEDLLIKGYDSIDVIGDASSPIKFSVDENCLLEALSEGDLRTFCNLDNVIELVYVLKNEVSSEGKTKLANEVGTDESLEYLDMYVTCPTIGEDIHETNEYQRIRIEVPNSYYGEGTCYDSSHLKVKHYKEVNGVTQVVELPKIDASQADNIMFECFYEDGDGIVVVTKNFSDYQLLGTTSNITKVDTSELSDLSGYCGEKLSTINLPNNWSWVDGDELISIDKDLYFALYNGEQKVALSINMLFKDEDFESSIEGDNKASCNDLSEIINNILNNTSNYYGLQEEINSKYEKQLSLRPIISPCDPGSVDEQDTKDYLQLSDITKDLIYATAYNIDLYLFYDGVKGNVRIDSICKPITYTLQIPEEIRKAPNGYRRKFYVVSTHNDNPKILSSRTSASNDTITVDISEYSIFAICYKDELIKVDNYYKSVNTGID